MKESPTLPPLPTFDTPDISHSSVFKHLFHLLPAKATRLDGISARLLQAAALSLCLSKRVFPTSWKVAQFKAVFKVGDYLNVGDYRAISILPVMFRIFKRHVHLVLYEYLNGHGLLFKYQSGFRPFYSCETAMIELVDSIFNEHGRWSFDRTIINRFS